MTRRNNLPQKYKLTEFGEIPQDWVLCTFEDVLTTFSSGATPYRGNPEYYKGNIRWISSGELNYNRITETLEHISQSAVRNTNLRVHQPDTFLIAITGLEAAGTRGKCAFIGAPSTTNQSCMALNGTNKMTVDYLFWFYRMWGNYLAFKYCQGTKQQSYTAAIVKKLPIYCPPTIKEQSDIAEVLSDVDALIAVLDKKIEKKRLIKQGAMQQLLAGKKRLAGFSEPWITKQIGDIAILYQPITIAQDQFTMQGYNVYGANGIIGKYSHYNHSTDQVLITCRGSSCGTVNYSKGYCWITGNAMVINMDGNKDVNKQFIYYLLSNNDLSELITGSGQPQIVRKVLSEYSIKIPSDYAEQYAIASILSDMDKEIADLEARRDKYTQIKSGMMQKLLTGQIRLIHKRQARIIPLDAHIVAGHIVNKLHESRGWGRTKLQKSLHLIGYHCQLDLGNEYIQNTAGPDDQKLMSYIDQKFLNYGQVRKVEFRDSAGRKHYNYVPTAKIDEIEFAFEQYPADIRNRINGLLAKIERMDLGRAEIISTLYAVWNNRLIKHEPISDDLLLADFYAWSDHKADFSRDLVLRGLDYMRQEGIIPTGWGQYIDKK